MSCSKFFSLFLLLIVLQLARANVVRNLEDRRTEECKRHKKTLLDELEELVKKHRQMPSNNVDMKKLKLLKEKMGEVSALMDEVFQKASGKTPGKVPPTKVPPKKIFTDCAAAKSSGNTASGVYSIQLDASTVRSVYCDMQTDGGGWTVFQRRYNGTVDFYRNWVDYKNGFGDANGEYWLGLDALNLLTKDGSQELYIRMEEFDGKTSYARYKKFKVESESLKYKLSVAQFSGPAGAGLDFHNNMPFSTKDRDNDQSSKSCAQERGGAWWYNNCMMSNLNGKYRPSAKASYSYGFSWYKLKGTYKYFLKGSAMMIRKRI